jgi:hypothetical protein
MTGSPLVAARPVAARRRWLSRVMRVSVCVSAVAVAGAALSVAVDSARGQVSMVPAPGLTAGPDDEGSYSVDALAVGSGTE